MTELDELMADARRRADLGALRRLLAVRRRLEVACARSLQPEILALAERQVSIMIYREDLLPTLLERAELVALFYAHLCAEPSERLEPERPA